MDGWSLRPSAFKIFWPSILVQKRQRLPPQGEPFPSVHLIRRGEGEFPNDRMILSIHHQGWQLHGDQSLPEATKYRYAARACTHGEVG